MKPPIKGQTYFIRERYDRTELKRIVILGVTKRTVRIQTVHNDGSTIIDPVPMPKGRNKAEWFFQKISIEEWNRRRRYWQLKKPDWAK